MNLFIISGIIILVITIYLYLKENKINKHLPVPTNQQKAITWIIHMYPPYHNAGAEWMAHCLNRYLVQEHGYTIYVFIPSKRFLGIKYKDLSTTFEGVHVYDIKNEVAMRHAIKHSRAICSHLNLSDSVRNFCKKENKPYIHFLHNSFESSKIKTWAESKNNPPTHLVANSEWIKKYYQEFNFPTSVLYPPVFWKDYAVPNTANRKNITLINLNKNKGGGLLPELAIRLPNQQFAGVKGGYDKQIIVPQSNITYIENTPHIQDIYADTKILLVPSAYESWGRVAVEAMSSGIPVIANPTAGLREALGNAGIFCDRDDIDAWINEINKLCSNPTYYELVSRKCMERAKELDPLPQMDLFAKMIENLDR